jgi:hypothetical protein
VTAFALDDREVLDAGVARLSSVVESDDGLDALVEAGEADDVDGFDPVDAVLVAAPGPRSARAPVVPTRLDTAITSDATRARCAT